MNAALSDEKLANAALDTQGLRGNPPAFARKPFIHTTMSKQYNKVIKRRRRKAYLARRKKADALRAAAK